MAANPSLVSQLVYLEPILLFKSSYTIQTHNKGAPVIYLLCILCMGQQRQLKKKITFNHMLSEISEAM